jgi:hypothetical protein
MKTAMKTSTCRDIMLRRARVKLALLNHQNDLNRLVRKEGSHHPEANEMRTKVYHLTRKMIQLEKEHAHCEAMERQLGPVVNPEEEDAQEKNTKV